MLVSGLAALDLAEEGEDPGSETRQQRGYEEQQRLVTNLGTESRWDPRSSRRATRTFFALPP